MTSESKQSHKSSVAKKSNKSSKAKYSYILTPSEENIVINVYRYVQNCCDDVEYEGHRCIADCSEKTAEITGLDKRQIYRLVKSKHLHYRQPVAEMVDEETLAAIREKILCFFHEPGHGVPTPANILREVNHDARLPNFTLPVFRRVLTHLKFRHIVERDNCGLTRRSETFSIAVV